jgi:hypothetical protein
MLRSSPRFSGDFNRISRLNKKDKPLRSLRLCGEKKDLSQLVAHMQMNFT